MSLYDPQLNELIGRYARLVPLQIEHAQALVEAANISRTTYQYTLVPHDLDSANAYIKRALEIKERGEAFPFATIEKNSSRVIGTTRFMSIEYWNWPEGSLFRSKDKTPDVVEIGATWLSEPFQRSGINTDAKILMLTHAFEVWNVHRVSLKTDARNGKSRRNIERVGAKFDGVLRAHMPAFDGKIRDTAYYSILRVEWPSVKGRLISRLK